MNPFLTTYTTPFQTVPFEDIKLEHFKPAFEKGMEEGKKEIETIKSNKEVANFTNTIEALERSGALMSKVSSVFFNLNSSQTSDEMQQLAQEISPLLTSYSNDLLMDEQLFERIKNVYKNTNESDLNEEQQMLLEETYTSFVSNGANLDKSKKEELKVLNTELAKLSLTFGENVLKDTNNFELEITAKSDLAGLPEGVVEAAQMTAKAKNKAGWVFTLDYPSYIPFMQYAENRTLRKKMYLAFGSKGFRANENNNEEIVKNIAQLRLQKANILGFSSHAEKTLKRRMAEKTENVFHLFDELLEKAKPIAKKELEEVATLSKEPLERWDFSFYSEQLKKQKFAINDEILKPYFQLEKVVDGAFATANKLYGITFTAIDTIQKYHKDVLTYEVKDEKENHLAVFYADFFPRESKRGGAWMTSFRGQNKYDGNEQRPHVSIVCNFTKPTESKPSLLTFNEVTTLFHEFGHALHGIFANGHYESLSGTSVFWDFVELPSQLMENWCYEKECLDLFAKHYETNELISMELVQKIKDSANFMSGYQTVRQVSLGKLDMAWHNLKTKTDLSVYDMEKEANKGMDMFNESKETLTSTAFSHIFQGGYSAGYYSYKWAEVLEADAFDFFKETGIFNTETAAKFKDNILSKGGSKHPMELYKAFRGKEPSTQALLKKSGLV